MRGVEVRGVEVRGVEVRGVEVSGVKVGGVEVRGVRIPCQCKDKKQCIFRISKTIFKNIVEADKRCLVLLKVKINTNEKI